MYYFTVAHCTHPAYLNCCVCGAITSQ